MRQPTSWAHVGSENLNYTWHQATNDRDWKPQRPLFLSRHVCISVCVCVCCSACVLVKCRHLLLNYVWQTCTTNKQCHRCSAVISAALIISHTLSSCSQRKRGRERVILCWNQIRQSTRYCDLNIITGKTLCNQLAHRVKVCGARMRFHFQLDSRKKNTQRQRRWGAWFVQRTNENSSMRANTPK